MECDHEPHLITHDHASGDQICTGCGLVLESFTFDEHSFGQGYSCGASLAEEHTFKQYEDPLKEVAHLKKLAKPFETIRNMGGHRLQLPDNIISTAIELLKGAYTAGFRIRNTNINTTAASSLYYACKIVDVDRAEIEIATNCGLTTKQLTVSNKQFRRALASSPWASKIYAPANPVRLIPRFLDALCSEPTLLRHEDKNKVRRFSEDIGYRASLSGALEGKTPECCCITFIYKALRDLQYPEDLIDAICIRCGLTPTTISNTLTILNQL